MKQLLISPLLLIAGTVAGQDAGGRISFKETIVLDIKEADIPEGMASLIPKEQTVEKVLFYNAGKSLYENAEVGNGVEENDYQKGNVTVHLERRMPEEKVFLDLTNKKCIQQKDLMGRLFLLNDDLENRKWKFTGRQKMLLEQPCMEAVSLEGDDSVTAWYTTAIPVAAGPQGFAGLPGMILELWNGSHIHIMATSIDRPDRALLEEKLKIPAKGKKITAAEFEELARKKAEEMQQQHGGKGIIIHQISR